MVGKFNIDEDLNKKLEYKTINRVSLDDIIGGLEEEHSNNDRSLYRVTSAGDYDKDLVDVLNKQNLPLNLSKIKGVYSLDMFGKYGYEYNPLGVVFELEDSILIASNKYGDGRALNLSFAYRVGDEVTMGHVHEKCSITDEREVETDTVSKIHRLDLPKSYDVDKLFEEKIKEYANSLPENIEDKNWYVNGCVRFGRILSGKKNYLKPDTYDESRY